MPSFYEGADAWFRTLLLNRVAGQAREYYFPFLARAMPARPVRDYPEFGGIKLSSFGTEGDFGIMDQIKVKVKKYIPELKFLAMCMRAATATLLPMCIRWKLLTSHREKSNLLAPVSQSNCPMVSAPSSKIARGSRYQALRL